MKSLRHPFLPEDREPMAALRQFVAPVKGHPIERAAFDGIVQQTPPALGVTYAEGKVGGIPGWWCLPLEPEAGAAILYLHGGAYIAGSAIAYRNFVGQIASRAKVRAFIPEYRLAPEHPFPAAIEDAQAAYEGLGREGFGSISIVGDSAGGGLALALLLLVSKAGAKPKAAAVMSPWTDLTLIGETMTSKGEADPLLTREVLTDAAHAYLTNVVAENPEASPLFGDLNGLPAVLIHVGEDEVLLDDSVRFAQRLSESGNQGELHVWEGMTHVFPSSLGQFAAAGKALDSIGEFLREKLMTNIQSIPADDPSRTLTVAKPNEDQGLRHLGVVGDTYTILVDGKQTAGRYCLIDMLVPKGGGPPPHRHDFEEMFTVLEGEIEATFRGEKLTLRAGETINIPANAPHQFTNASDQPARLLCLCSPAGQEEFFMEMGVVVPTRTTPAPKLEGPAQAEMIAKAIALSPKYRTELLR